MKAEYGMYIPWNTTWENYECDYIYRHGKPGLTTFNRYSEEVLEDLKQFNAWIDPDNYDVLLFETKCDAMVFKMRYS